MILLTRTVLPFLLDRISGVDGYYTAFRLAFYGGTDPQWVTEPPPSNPLAQYDFSSPWATPSNGTQVAKIGPIETTVLATGVPSFWRLLGFHDGVWSSVVHGSTGLAGSNADIKVRTLEWVVGDPLALQVLRIYPLKLSY